MLSRRTTNGILWIDALSPTRDEVRSLMNEFRLAPRVAEELLTPTYKPLCHAYEHVVFLVLHFPILSHTGSNEKNQEVDFIIGRDFLITVRYDAVASLRRIAQNLEVANTLETASVPYTGAFLFYLMIEELYAAVGQELDVVEGKLARIEACLFDGNDYDLLRDISELGKNLLDLEHTLEGHEERLREFSHDVDRIISASFGEEFRHIRHAYYSLSRRIKERREFLAELRITNDSLLSARQNKVVKTLTTIAFATLPATLVATILGMSFVNTPFYQHPEGFWVALIGIVLVTSLTFLFLRFKRWLD